MAVIFGLLLAGEFLWRKTKAKNEFTRKFIHITVGSFVAFFPYFLSSHEIKFISGAFLVAVLFSRYFNIFKSIHSVKRLTEGEFWFALTVLALAFSPIEAGVFTVSLLTMSLADGFAAIIGTHYGKSTQYRIMGSTKSVIGTFTFFLVSGFLMVIYSYLTIGPTVTPWFVLVAFVATGLENISYRGVDNLTVPLAVAGLLYIIQ